MRTGLLLTGSIAALGFAYAVRFLALSYGATEAGLKRATPSIDRAVAGAHPGVYAVLARQRR